MKRLILVLATAIVVAAAAVAWVGYGNPFRAIPLYGNEVGEDISQLFYVDYCRPDRTCEVKPEHERVMHYSFGDGYMEHPGGIEGNGRNPIVLIREAGLEFLPRPDTIEAALKWCTSEEILQVFGRHGRFYVTPLTDDPLATARCVKNQLPRSFSVSIADPMSRDEDRETFRSLHRTRLY